MRIRPEAAAALLAGLLVLTAAPATAGASPAPADRVEVPVAGTFVVQGLGAEVRGAVHAVRRVPGATAVYYSVGVRGEQDWAPNVALPGPRPGDPYGPTDAYAVQLVDTVALQRYAVMVDDDGDCLCPQTYELGTEGGVLRAAWALLPPLPPEVERVSVQVAADALVEDVPVEDGALEPAVAEPSTVLGQAWPALPDASGVSDPSAFVAALVRNAADRAGTVTTQERPGQVDESLAADVLFAVDSATLTPQAQATLRALAGRLRDRASGTVQVVGHTDTTGEDAYNRDLSLRRAQAVVAALQADVGAGVPLQADGRGETEPVADEATPEGRALNRRVTVTYAVEGAA